MTPLLAAKTRSAPAGDKSGGDTRAARSLLSCALWHGAAMARHGRHGAASAHRRHGPFAPSRVVRAPSAITAFFRNRAFLVFESRNTKHETRITAFVVARHGAAMARHGRPPSPAPQHGLLGFRRQRITQPVFLLSSGDSKKSNSKPGLQGFHESRITRHESRLFFESRLFIRFDALPTSLHFSPRGEVKCVRGPSGRGARRLARAGVLEPYVEHGKQAQRSPGARIACFDRRVVRNAG